MPLILLLSISATLLLAPFLPLEIKRGLYATALSIKSIIVLLLPLIILGLLFKATVTLSSSGSHIMALILVLVCSSNFIATFLSHYVGIWVYHCDLPLMLPKAAVELTPLWSLSLPTVVANEHAILAGILFGLLGAKYAPTPASCIAIYIEHSVHRALRAILYIIPLFVTGFMLKLHYEGVLSILIKQYGTIFALIVLAQLSYLALLYWLCNGGKIVPFLHHLRCMLPAAISGFSTLSSAASLPLSLMGIEKSVHNKVLAHSVVPLTVNIHLIGDCFAIPILAYAVLKSFALPEPSLMNYVIFSVYFVLAKFSVAAIPGGGILIMLPILQTYLGFNAEMMSLITALYMLFDPVITSVNILGNGAFAKLVDRCASLIRIG